MAADAGEASLVRELRSRCNGLQGERDAARAELDAHKSRISTMRKQAAADTQRIQKLEAELQRKSQETAELESRLREQQTRADDLQLALEREKAQADFRCGGRAESFTKGLSDSALLEAAAADMKPDAAGAADTTATPRIRQNSIDSWPANPAETGWRQSPPTPAGGRGAQADNALALLSRTVAVSRGWLVELQRAPPAAVAATAVSVRERARGYRLRTGAPEASGDIMAADSLLLELVVANCELLAAADHGPASEVKPAAVGASRLRQSSRQDAPSEVPGGGGCCMWFGGLLRGNKSYLNCGGAERLDDKDAEDKDEKGAGPV
eukprot:TRINITY_DN61623_c0_g1_i1.p2 TRINITY_DN61623_c0_g1~~TRINITY_DN61623_c0_g1_i1.p2  ORF type:complete len:347 (+),score=97.18 TRINITY_DN61623_c0_g1_i1:70-1041(+)